MCIVFTFGQVKTERSKIMANSKNNINADIIMNGQKFGKVISFKYLEATLCSGCSESDAVRHSHVTIGSRATGQIQTLYGQTLAPCTTSAGMENCVWSLT